jgi:hypothetical protein
MIGVNGWYSANHRSPAGSESVGTNPLPKKGSSVSGMGRLLAPSTVFVTRPIATASHTRANATAARNPAAASHSTAVASGRKPTSTATPRTTASWKRFCSTLPSTCPVRTDTRAIAMVRNRAMMPSLMSIATEIAVPCTALAMAMSRMPGVT